jgi:hypothetical protein
MPERIKLIPNDIVFRNSSGLPKKKPSILTNCGTGNEKGGLGAILC